jgi:hypothetical protein
VTRRRAWILSVRLSIASSDRCSRGTPRTSQPPLCCTTDVPASPKEAALQRRDPNATRERVGSVVLRNPRRNSGKRSGACPERRFRRTYTRRNICGRRSRSAVNLCRSIRSSVEVPAPWCLPPAWGAKAFRATLLVREPSFTPRTLPRRRSPPQDRLNPRPLPRQDLHRAPQPQLGGDGAEKVFCRRRPRRRSPSRRAMS